MSIKDKLRRQKDGSYILASKANESKTGDCLECGENPTIRSLLFRYKAEDLKLVKEYIESQLSRYLHQSMTPIWCKKCQCLLKYKTTIRTNATRQY